MTTPPMSTGEYAVWRELARRVRRWWGRGAQVPKTTSLANETYVRLAKAHELVLENGRVPEAVVVLSMKRVLFDHYRQQSALKRGGVTPNRPLGESGEPVAGWKPSPLEMVDAIESLRQIRPRQAQVVDVPRPHLGRGGEGDRRLRAPGRRRVAGGPRVGRLEAGVVTGQGSE